MRGKHSGYIIPTIGVQDHPRGCGENVTPFRQECYGVGSPPRMRGKQNCPARRARLAGITPADAGKTPLRYSPVLRNEDHPRGCGENRLSDKPSRLKPGSPPRMRGKPSTTSKTSLRSGITPADAGKTRRVYANDTHKRDHPRGCGENFVVSRSKRRAAGSPPRMRGKRANAQKIAQQFRITPADAGKTLCLPLLTAAR